MGQRGWWGADTFLHQAWSVPSGLGEGVARGWEQASLSRPRSTRPVRPRGGTAPAAGNLSESAWRVAAGGPSTAPASPVCTPPMVYVDCRNATPGAAGAGCQKSCLTLDMECVSVPHAPRDPSWAPAAWPSQAGPRKTPARTLSGPPAGRGGGALCCHLRHHPRPPDLCVVPHSTAPGASPAACAPTGWWPTVKAAVSPWRTVPACTTRPATCPARPSGWAATLGRRGPGTPPRPGRPRCGLTVPPPLPQHL